jgi:hypothetical protein
MIFTQSDGAGHKCAQDGASWDDLSFVADGLRSVLGPAALLYENDAFHQGLLDMPHVPRSLNFFSADGARPTHHRPMSPI